MKFLRYLSDSESDVIGHMLDRNDLKGVAFMLDMTKDNTQSHSEFLYSITDDEEVYIDELFSILVTKEQMLFLKRSYVFSHVES